MRTIAPLRHSTTQQLSESDAGAGMSIELFESIFDAAFAERLRAEILRSDLEHDMRRRLEYVLLTYSDGFRAIDADDFPQSLEATPVDFRGFAYEGAASGLAFADYRAEGASGRLAAFLRGAGAHHPHLVHLGVGASPVLRRRFGTLMAQMDPLYSWFAFDGAGYREAYVYRERTLSKQEVPVRFPAFGREAFDRGVGRALWFVHAADVPRVVSAIDAFPEERRGAMWAGLGFVCIYTGACDAARAAMLREAAGARELLLAGGAALATHARERGGVSTARSELLCHALTGISPREAAQIVEEAAVGLPPDTEAEPQQSIWVARIRAHLSSRRTEARP
jgi:enediyne biosynthesis protein E3